MIHTIEKKDFSCLKFFGCNSHKRVSLNFEIINIVVGLCFFVEKAFYIF